MQRLVVVAVFIATAAGVGHAQSRIEIHPIESVTLTSQQVLLGDKNGRPALLAGELRLPTAATGKLPAVILVHGSGGLSTGYARWAEELNSIGVATLLLDSFTGRGITNTIEDQSSLANLAMMVDAYRALDVLARHPRIDPKRIAVMGFSKGGVAAVYSSNERFRQMYAPAGIQFAAHIGMYTSCSTRYRDDDKVTGKPIRMFHGTADDWTLASACHAYVERLRKASADAILVEYPGAMHAYDSIAYKTPLEFKKAQTTRNCDLVEGENGLILNSKTRKAFDWNDECIERGTHIGYNEAAAVATTKAVKEFLTSVFNLTVPK